MFRLLSLFAILAGPAAALVYAGRLAFGSQLPPQPDDPLYAVFHAFPAEAAYMTPLLAVALVAAGYFVLRLIGFAVSVIGTAAILAMIVAVFFKPEWIDTVRQLLVAQ